MLGVRRDWRETGVGKRVAGPAETRSQRRKAGDGGGWDAGMGRRGTEGGAGTQGREVWEASLPSGSMSLEL